MKLKLLAVTAFAVTTASAMTPVPALAYDPCARAQADVERAEADINRWYAQNCPRNGKCWGDTNELLALGQRVQDARARRSRSCN